MGENQIKPWIADADLTEDPSLSPIICQGLWKHQEIMKLLTIIFRWVNYSLWSYRNMSFLLKKSS